MAVEAHAVEDSVENEVAAVEQDVAHLRQHTTHLVTLPVTSLQLFSEEVEPRMATSLLRLDPIFCLFNENIDLIPAMCNTYRGKFFHFTVYFLNDNDTDVAGTMHLLSYKHS